MDPGRVIPSGPNAFQIMNHRRLPDGIRMMLEGFVIASYQGSLTNMREFLIPILEFPHTSITIEETSKYFSEAFMHAIERYNFHISEFLFDQGPFKPRITPDHIIAAMRSRSFDILKLIRRHGWDMNASLDFGFVTSPPISLALGDEMLFRWLLYSGASINNRVQEDIDYTPLSAVVHWAVPSMVHVCFERGYADIRKGHLLHNVMYRGLYGSVEGIPELAQLALPHTFLRTESDCLHLIDYLLAWGANINYRLDETTSSMHASLEGASHATPLYLAACLGNIAAVRHLLERGADPDIKSLNGTHASDAAKALGYAKIAELLSTSTPELVHSLSTIDDEGASSTAPEGNGGNSSSQPEGNSGPQQEHEPYVEIREEGDDNYDDDDNDDD
ncbi:ankyrin [Xylona heveae TC161]|uniref:Ankyrin n=1 Tax=Xylona heveae (strain CBS 132557 / TC161) TaxID=1328760 RepID=A0A165ACX5_XYLHT|nr:ankyrin [Xylona heveae TC161]KZF20269.1 ankyrin [Xylona heveae TC161]